MRRLSIKEIVRRTGHGRNTIRRALRSAEAPRYRRLPRPSKLDPFRDEVHRLLRSEPRLPGKRVRELLEEQGYAGGKTILLWTAVVWVAALVPVLVLAAHDTGLISPLVVLPFLLPFVLLIWVGALLFIYGSAEARIARRA